MPGLYYHNIFLKYLFSFLEDIHEDILFVEFTNFDFLNLVLPDKNKLFLNTQFKNITDITFLPYNKFLLISFLKEKKFFNCIFVEYLYLNDFFEINDHLFLLNNLLKKNGLFIINVYQLKINYHIKKIKNLFITNDTYKIIEKNNFYIIFKKLRNTNIII